MAPPDKTPAPSNEAPTPMNELATGGSAPDQDANGETQRTRMKKKNKGKENKNGKENKSKKNKRKSELDGAPANAKQYWKQQYSGHTHGERQHVKREACDEPCETRPLKRQHTIPTDTGHSQQRTGELDGTSIRIKTEEDDEMMPATTSGQEETDKLDSSHHQIKVEGETEAGQATLVVARTAIQERNYQVLREIAAGIDRANQQAVEDLENLQEATKSFGTDRCKAVDGKWKLAGFKTPLYNHQLLGVRWMCSREFHPHGPHGGILADEMGLGKTIQLLALMSQNPPDRKAKALKTLIIAPEKLLTQWLREVQDHCEKRGMSVMVYKKADTAAGQLISQNDIIITNYAQLQRQAPVKEALAEIEEMRDNQDLDWVQRVRDNAGPLYQIEWYRVVLDEAHAINNRTSTTSKACRYLPAKHRWVLTGTPMTNHTDEIFPYLDFLGTKYRQFSSYYEALGNVDGDEEQMRQLQTILSDLTLRRQVNAELMGAPILQIPRAHPVEVIKVELSPFEREIYTQKQEELKKLGEKGSYSRAIGAPSGVSRRCLRKALDHLRFFSSHPALVEYNWYNKQEKVEDPSSLPVNDEVKCTCFCMHCARVATKSPRLVEECGHLFCGTCYSNQIKKQKAAAETPHCPSCKGPNTSTKPGLKNCPYHQMDDLPPVGKTKPWRKFGGDDNGMQPAFGTRKISEKAKKDHPEKEEEGDPKKPSKKKGKSKKAPVKKTKLNKSESPKPKQARSTPKKQKYLVEKVQSRRNAARFVNRTDKTPWNPVPHSAKTKATINLVNRWQSEAPDDKIIIFVQWIPMLSILGRILYQNGHRFVYLWGEMDTNEQDKSITDFKNNPDIKIMLISVTCGAHGLNLTVANRAIVYDHWWHVCLERQAFARVHRIGQSKEVHLAKIVALGTVDEEILKRQERKAKSIANVMEGMGQETLPISEVCEFLGMGEDMDFVVNDETMKEDADYIDAGSDSGEGSDETADSESGSSSEEDESSDEDSDDSSDGSSDEGGSDDGGDEESSGSDSD